MFASCGLGFRESCPQQGAGWGLDSGGPTGRPLLPGAHVKSRTPDTLNPKTLKLGVFPLILTV